jgi:serine/threonine protein kinase
MEFIEGMSLADKLMAEGTKMEMGEAVRIISYTARALQHAHDHNIIHRDIKPENIMLTTQGRIKVMDFGIAFSGEMPRITQRGFAVGTPQYMSPEQLRGRPVEGPSDIYSVSVLFFFLVTGKLPFDDEDPRELGLKHIKAQPPNPMELSPDCPPLIAELILKGLQKKPEDRFTRIQELVDNLQEFLLASSAPSLTSALVAFENSRDGSSPQPIPKPIDTLTKGDPMDMPEDLTPKGPVVEEEEPELDSPPKLHTPSKDPFTIDDELKAELNKAASQSVGPAQKKTGALVAVILFVVLALGAGGFYMLQEQKKAQVEQLLNEGNALLNENNLDAAEEKFRAANTLSPQLGTPLDSLKIIERKRSAFREALSQGKTLLELDADRAKDALTRAYEALPKRDPATSELSELLFQLGKTYEEGDANVASDLAEALKVYQMSADLGNSAASDRLKELGV